MKAAELQILLVAQDGELIVEISQALMLGVAANLTVSDNCEQAQILAACDGYDVIIACQRLNDGTGLSLLSDLSAKEISTPVILLDQNSDSQVILTALRHGAFDVLNLPIDGDRLIASVKRAAGRRREQLQLVARTRRLRRLSSRLVKDRRELRSRVDLICRDLVTAYRKLAEKVISAQDAETRETFELDAE